MRISRYLNVVVLLMACASAVVAQQESATVSPMLLMQDPEARAILFSLQNDWKFPSRSGTYVVEGENRYQSWVLTAERIEFGPGARLIFPAEVASRRQLFILAKEIVSVDPNDPGSIVFSESLPDLPGSMGSADAGRSPGGRGGR
ncbi:MAG: hypothetical protein AAFY88_16360, partial [Acidobacteriota bacterium]